MTHDAERAAAAESAAEQFERFMVDAFRAAPSQPDLMVINLPSAEMIRVVSEEEQRRREVCTPLGLRRMLPGLR